MKIVVCIKQVIDITFHFKLDQDTHMPFEEDVFYMVNPADRCAAEAALKIKEEHGCEVIFVGFGPPRIEQALRSCLSMGGDRAIRVWDSDLDTGSYVTAYMLAGAMGILSPDIVLCGNRSLDEGRAEIPGFLAGILDFPQVTGITDLELSSDRKRVIVKRKLERGRRESIECPLPTVLSIEPGIEQPRYAALPRLLDAHAAEINRMDVEALGIDVSQIKALDARRRLIRRSLPRPRPKKTFTFESGLSAEERMELIMSGGLRESKTDLLEGSTQEVTGKLVEIFEKKVFAREYERSSAKK